MANVNHEWKEEALKIYNYQETEKKSLSFIAAHFEISKTKAYQYTLVGQFLSKNPDVDIDVFSDCLNRALRDASDILVLKDPDSFTIVRLLERSPNFYIVEILNRKTEFKRIAIRPYESRPAFDWEIQMWKRKS